MEVTKPANPDAAKVVSKSVALPNSMWDAIDVHAPTTPGRDRSGYIRGLVEADLKKNGPLAKEEAAKAALIAAGEQFRGGLEGALEALAELSRPSRRRAA